MTEGDYSVFRDGLAQGLRTKDGFINFVSFQFSEIASIYDADIELDKDRSCVLAFDRYVELHDMFARAIGKGEPSEYKIAAALSFALRRAQPIVEINPNSWKKALESGNVHAAMYADGELSEQYKLFYSFANEICSFSIGLRLAHFYSAQRNLGSVVAIDQKTKISLLVREMARIDPDFSENFKLDNLFTLRDHAVSPFSLYVLYQAVFDISSSTRR
jgi:hypothetical protein